MEDKILNWLMCLLLALGFLLLLSVGMLAWKTAFGPKCIKSVDDGTYLQPMLVGKVTILMPMKKTKCLEHEQQ